MFLLITIKYFCASLHLYIHFVVKMHVLVSLIDFIHMDW